VRVSLLYPIKSSTDSVCVSAELEHRLADSTQECHQLKVCQIAVIRCSLNLSIMHQMMRAVPETRFSFPGLVLYIALVSFSCFFVSHLA